MAFAVRAGAVRLNEDLNRREIIRDKDSRWRLIEIRARADIKRLRCKAGTRRV